MTTIRASRQSASPQRGFTLVEALVTVAVIGILAAVALPSFLDSIRKSHRSDAFAALAAVQQAQERWRGNHSAYTTSLTAGPADVPPGLGLRDTSSKGYYTISIDAAGATGYTATATAVSGTSQAGDGNCQRLRVRVLDGNLFYGAAAASGDFDESATNRCWVR
jgi:type IV pilus assembly protein PilE